MVKVKAGYLHFLLPLSLVAIVFFRMAPALLHEGITVSAPGGDGLGGMSWNYCMGLFIREFGWAEFLSKDIFYNPYFGGGLNSPAVYFQPWKIAYGFVSQYFSIDQVWDLVIFLGISLTAIATYWVGHLLGLNPVFSALCAFLAINMENIDLRIVGHNTLAFWFGPLLMWGAMIKWLRSLSWPALMLLCLTSVLSVAANEYLAWYGGLFVAAFGAVVLVEKFRRGSFPFAKFLVQALFGLLMIGVMLKLVFPSMFGGLFNAVSAKPAASDYNLYSFRTPGSIFVPNFIVEFNWLPRKWHGVKGEMTFRLGLFFWITFGALFAKYRKIPGSFRRQFTIVNWGLVVSGVFLLAAALPLSSPPWVSLFFSKLVPMFRSILRAMLFFNVAMIFLLGIMVQVLWKFRKTQRKTEGMILAALLVGPAIVFDMSLFARGFGAYRTFHLPAAEESELALTKVERGLLLELPIEDREDERDRDSQMMFRFSQHQQPILNWVRSSLPSPYESSYEYLRELSVINPGQLIEYARKMGVRYLLIENQMRSKWPSDAIEVIATGKTRTAYRIENALDVSVGERSKILAELGKNPLLPGPYRVRN